MDQHHADPLSSLYANEVVERIVGYMTYRNQCWFQMASRGTQTLVKAVQRKQTKWPEFLAAVAQKNPENSEDIFNKLAKFDEKARVVDRSNNYYWYQKCPVCMQSKEMDMIKETAIGMQLRCPICTEKYGCAILWNYAFNVIPCGGCRSLAPKGFVCFSCKTTYCQDCKFYHRVLNAYGCNQNVCDNCVADCGHGCDWRYVIGHATKCSDCNEYLCARCAEWGSDCLDADDDDDDSDEEDDEVEDDEEEDEEESD